MARIDNLTNFLTDVATAIKAKKGDETPIAASNFDTEITNLLSGDLKEKDINFYDYDGTLLYSYFTSDFLALNSMPDNPTHEGLIAQGWNWSLNDAQNYVNDYNTLDIGQTYITDDNTTRIYIILNEDYLNPYLGLGINGTIEVDWGDQSTSEISGTSIDVLTYTQHTYAQPGKYIISIGGAGSIQIFSSGNLGYSLLTKAGALTSVSDSYPYNTNIKKIEFGNNVLIGEHAFWNCYNLETITLPNSISTIGKAAFAVCYHLKNVVFPSTLKSIKDNAFQNCAFTNILLPKNFLTMGSYAFTGCYLLKRAILPNGDDITYGERAFQNCYSLLNVIVPSGSLSANVFNNCSNLISAILDKKISHIDNSLFSGCTALSQIEILNNSITTTGVSLFNGCRSLAKITLPTQLTTLNTNIFSNCYTLSSVIIPNTITVINSGAFRNCYCLTYCDFSNHTTVPTLNDINVFTNASPKYKIIVPDNLYESWVMASNWSDTSIVNHIIKKSDWDAL